MLPPFPRSNAACMTPVCRNSLQSSCLEGEGLAADEHDEGDHAQAEDVHRRLMRCIVHHLRRHKPRGPQRSCRKVYTHVSGVCDARRSVSVQSSACIIGRGPGHTVILLWRAAHTLPTAGGAAPVTGFFGSYMRLMPRSMSFTAGCRLHLACKSKGPCVCSRLRGVSSMHLPHVVRMCHHSGCIVSSEGRVIDSGPNPKMVQLQGKRTACAGSSTKTKFSPLMSRCTMP